MSVQIKNLNSTQPKISYNNGHDESGDFPRRKKLVSTKEAAEAIDGSPWWLYQNQDNLRGLYRLGRSLRWNLDELLECLRARSNV